MSGLLTRANEAAVLSTGLYVTWRTQEWADGDELADGGTMPLPVEIASGNSNAGVDVTDAVYASVSIGVRAEPSYRTATVRVSTLDAGEDYTVTIDGTAVEITSGGSDTADDVLQALADALNADGTVSPLVEAKGPEDTGGASGKLLIYGQSEDDYSIAVSATGSGVLGCVADAAEATAEIYGSHRKSPALGWRRLNGAEDLAVGPEGWIEELRVGPLGRLYCRLTSVTKVAGDGASVRYAPPILIGVGGVE